MKHIHKLLALFLCLCLFVGAAVPALADDFDDYWGYEDDYRSFRVEEALAEELHALGLLNGAGTNPDGSINYALDRSLKRVEALVLYIRVIGEEQEALSQDWPHPFTDVPKWADQYVGYAYAKGYTNGVSADKFGTSNATASQYLTFMLRALGYTDSGANPDFTWSDPYELASSLGLLPYQVDTVDFLRADAVSISYAALDATTKTGGGAPLSERLIEQGVFSEDKYTEVTGKGAIYVRHVMDAEEIYATCSSAVFYIEVYDADGWITKTGSGFFINRDGMAVTNYHVISGGAGLDVYTTDGAWYDVAGIYDYSVEEDWAVIQVMGTGFDYLRIDDSDPVGGATVYTLGSPLGLQNTIAQGIISNPARWDSGVQYIQTSAAISHGSSGGALINKYGEVIGITSATYEDGQNLNLALPMWYVMQMDAESGLYSFAQLAESEIFGYLTLSESEVEVAAGDYLWIDCTADVYGDDVTYYLEFDIDDETIADAWWDDDWVENTIGLEIDGLAPGSTTVTIWLYGNDQVLDIQTVWVTVK